MDTQEFISAVRSMRRAQNTYFQNGRKYSDLISAKAWEQIVDRALREGVAIPVAGVLEQLDGPPGEGIQIPLITEDDNEAKSQ